MPKIIISEKDNTSGGFRNYSNFSVAIPGFVDEAKLSAFLEKEENKDKVIFDENGIYECSDPADFKEIIGLRNPKIDILETRPSAPEISKVFYVKATASDDTPTDYPGKDSELALNVVVGSDEVSGDTEFITALINGNLYLATAQSHAEVGKLKDLKYGYTQVTSSTNGAVTAEVLDIDGDGGGDNSLILVEIQQNIASNAFYCILASEGDDGTSGTVLGTTYHHGNQIAYELLNLGYTVLYKKLGDELLDVDTEVEVETDILNKGGSFKLKVTAIDTDAPFSLSITNDSDPAVDYGVSVNANGGELSNSTIESEITLDTLEADTYAVTPTNCNYEIYAINDTATELVLDGGSIPILKYQTALESDEFWRPFKDKTTYDFRYVMTGLIENTAKAGNAIARLAEGITKEEEFNYATSGRGDCFALVDIDRTCYAGNQNTSEAVQAIKESLEDYPNSAYSALFAPTVRYSEAQLASASLCKNAEMPASFHYLACAANAFSNFNEWYAVAGYTRGVSRLSVVGTGAKFGDLAVEELQPRTKVDGGVDKAVNLVINLKGTYYLWGNRTAKTLNANEELKAQHFLNIRQLCTTIKKQTWTACRRYTYDPNSDVLWIKFCAAIKPTLDKMKADQGISDYKITKRKTDKKGVLSARIRIVPIEAVEDFYINLSLEDSLVGVVMDEGETE